MVKTLSNSIREYKKDSIMSVIYIIFEVIMECIIPFILANLVNGIRSNIPIGDLFKQGLILVVMAMLSLAFGILAGKKSAVASAGFARNLRKDIFEKVQGFSFENIDSFSNSSLLTRLTTDVTNVQNAYMMTIRLAIRSPFMFVFSFVMSFIMGGKLAFIFVIVVPILLIGLAFIIIKAMKIFKKIFYKYDDMNNTIQENIKAIRLVKSLVREDFEIKKFDKVASEVKHDFTIAEKIISLYAPLMQFCLYVDTVLILFLGSYVIVAGINPSFNVGQISALMTYSFMILSSLMMFSMVLVMLTMAMESSKRISEVLNTESTITDEKSLHKVVNSGEIEFKKHEKTGEIYLIEINARTTNFNNLIYKLGINMPYIAYLDLTGNLKESDCKYIDYDTNYAFIYGFEDMIAIWRYKKTKQVGILKSLKISFSRKWAPAIFAVDDLKPWFFFNKILLGKVFRKIFRRK